MNLDKNGNFIAEGLSGRIRSLARVIDRLDRLESGSGKWLENFHANELHEAATELALRAFRTATDPINYQILSTLENHNTLPLNALLDAISLTRLPLTERLNDLVQVGLVSRLVDTDHAQITTAGAGMVALLQDLIEVVILQMNNEVMHSEQ